MASPPSLYEAAAREMEQYQFVAGPELQPRWDIPEEIAIHTAISGRGAPGTDVGASSLEGYVDEASAVIENGACAVHFDFSFVEDPQGRRLDKLPPTEAYSSVIDPLRDRFGRSFVADCNVLNGSTFEECLSPARAGLAEIAPCAPGHPEEFMVPAVTALEEAGVKPQLAIHSSGEIELAKRKLIDTGILKKPYYFILLYGMPFNVGRTLISGTYVPNARDMAQHMFLMVDQLRALDESCQIVVCAAGRSSLYMTTLATMLGLHIRVGVEDTQWKYPHRDELLESNAQMVQMAKTIAELHGRRPATADEYRSLLGIGA